MAFNDFHSCELSSQTAETSQVDDRYAKVLSKGHDLRPIEP